MIEELKKYKKRKTSYLIPDDNGIYILTNDFGEYYLIGGGKIKNESSMQCLLRECMEETGFSLSNVKEFVKVKSCEHNRVHGDIEYDSVIYTGNLDKKEQQPIENEYLIKVPIEKAIKLMTQKIHREALIMYERRNRNE